MCLDKMLLVIYRRLFRSFTESYAYMLILTQEEHNLTVFDSVIYFSYIFNYTEMIVCVEGRSILSEGWIFILEASVYGQL